jgi:DNA polymerase-3 subunit alpha
MPYGQVDRVAKLVPFNPAHPPTLEQALVLEPRLAEAAREDEQVARLIAIAQQLEGLPRHASTHAAGVVIGDRPLDELVPLYRDPRADMPVTQFNMKDVEKAGLVKFDFLGLTTLTLLALAERLVNQRGHALDLAALPLDDPATFELLGRGETAGVFQLESSGMRDALRKLKPDCFEDIVAMNALYRPGPMDNIPRYINCKHGTEQPEYLHPLLEPILKETYGVIIYQEQVMQVARELAGYSLGGADLLRRAMGKKIKAEMDAQREVFIEGATARQIPHRLSASIFEQVAKFASYGFPKAHATAYALLAYHTAYMKAHHNAAFMAANLSAVMDDTDKVRMFRDDAVANGIAVLPPDINASVYRFVPVDLKTVRYGLGGVRGTGQSAIESVLEARKAGPFKDVFDFCRRVDKRLVNRRCVEALVRAGAFDALHPNRASLLASVGRAIEAAEQAERAASQNSLFGDADAGQTAGLVVIDARPWDLRQQLTEEKAALGYCLSAHLFSVYEKELAGFPRTSLAKLTNAGTAWVAGVVSSARVQMTRRGRMMVVMLDDGSAQQEISVFNELFEKHRDKLKEDALLVVCGKVQDDQFSGGLRVVADELLDLDGLRARYAARLKISMNGGADAKRLQQVLAPYRASGTGACQVVVSYGNGKGACEVVLGEGWRVRPEAKLLSDLGDWLAPENVELTFSS